MFFHLVYAAQLLCIATSDRPCMFKVSSWTLAREVNRNGELGVISGTAMETVVCRCLFFPQFTIV